MKKLLILIISISTFFSCSNDDSSDINIRISNISQFEYKNIVINTSTGSVDYENLNSGQFSEFQNFELAYRYAFIELEADGKTYSLQPIDYVGETPLKNGNYTYEIDVGDSQGQYGNLSLTLIEE